MYQKGEINEAKVRTQPVVIGFFGFIFSYIPQRNPVTPIRKADATGSGNVSSPGGVKILVGDVDHKR